MSGEDYAKILDSMQETGVYVVREEDHRILYYNNWVHKDPPKPQLFLLRVVPV